MGSRVELFEQIRRYRGVWDLETGAPRGGPLTGHDGAVSPVAVGELAPIRVGPDEGEVAPSTTFTFALLLADGIPAALFAQSLGSLTADVVHRKPFIRAAFNVAQYVLAIAAAGTVLVVTGVLPHGDGFDPNDIPAFIAAGVVFFVVNTWLVAGAVALTTGTRLRDQVSTELIRQSATEAILIGLPPLAVLALGPGRPTRAIGAG